MRLHGHLPSWGSAYSSTTNLDESDKGLSWNDGLPWNAGAFPASLSKVSRHWETARPEIATQSSAASPVRLLLPRCQLSSLPRALAHRDSPSSAQLFNC